MTNISFEKIVNKHLSNLNYDNVLLHSDITYGFNIPFINKNEFLKSHINKLIDLFEGSNLIVPTFNYDYCKSGLFDLRNDKSTLGVISEFFRISYSKWRTKVPVFNFCGFQFEPRLEISSICDPFGPNSIFAYLHNNNGLLVHYGSNFNTSTLIHYAERISENLIYRYDKHFYGNIITNTENIQIDLLYHVWPMNLGLKYDWNKIETDLVKDYILHEFKYEKTKISFSNINDLVLYWKKKLQDDPFYFLDHNSKILVNKIFNKLNRKFLITDFE